MKSQEKVNTITARITPAQQELLHYCRHIEAADLLQSFKITMECAVFNIVNDDKEKMHQAYGLCEIFQKLTQEDSGTMIN